MTKHKRTLDLTDKDWREVLKEVEILTTPPKDGNWATVTRMMEHCAYRRRWIQQVCNEGVDRGVIREPVYVQQALGAPEAYWYAPEVAAELARRTKRNRR